MPDSSLTDFGMTGAHLRHDLILRRWVRDQKKPLELFLDDTKAPADGMAWFLECFPDWIGLREILQETIDFPIKSGAFL